MKYGESTRIVLVQHSPRKKVKKWNLVRQKTNKAKFLYYCTNYIVFI